MVSNFRPHREPLRNVLMLLPLLFLAGLVSACGYIDHIRLLPNTNFHPGDQRHLS